MDGADNSLGLYLAIPFCRAKCVFCNFSSLVQGVDGEAGLAHYLDRLVADIGAVPDELRNRGLALGHRLDSVYVGGGTPTLLAPAEIARLFASVRAAFELAPGAEITVESPPGQLDEATVAALASAGVNRLSLGVQSFIEREAALTGRRQSRAQVEAALARLRAAGLANINLDLIAGLPTQTAASWEESLSALIDCGVPHASIYLLELDEASRLGREALAGGHRYHVDQLPDEETSARMYERAVERLTAAGLAQYEISNFARPGCESRHNLRYWRRQPYLGLGLDAASAALRAADAPVGRQPGLAGESASDQAVLYSEGLPLAILNTNASPKPLLWRATTTANLETYLEGRLWEEEELLGTSRQHEEAWFLGLRLNEGVDTTALAQSFGQAAVARALDRARAPLADGLLSASGSRLRLTPRGRLLANEVFALFLDLDEDEPPRG